MKRKRVAGREKCKKKRRFFSDWEKEKMVFSY